MKIADKIMEKKAKVEAWAKDHKKAISGACLVAAGFGMGICTSIVFGKSPDSDMVKFFTVLPCSLPNDVEYTGFRYDGSDLKYPLVYFISDEDVDMLRTLEKARDS